MLIATAMVLHYGFSIFGILPQHPSATSSYSTERFEIDYTFWLNLIFLAATGVLFVLRLDRNHNQTSHHGNGNQGFIENLLFWLAILSYLWLAGGLIVTLLISR